MLLTMPAVLLPCAVLLDLCSISMQLGCRSQLP